MPLPRHLTAAECIQYQRWFPRLNVAHAVVTDEISPLYNCIAWTVGITNRWIWPGNTLSQFDAFYAGLGFVRAGDGPIAAWGRSTAAMTHGCVSGARHGPRWESKCGAHLRIQHGLQELTSSTYGRVLAFYRKASQSPASMAGLVGELMKESTTKKYLSAGQRKALRAIVATIPPEFQRRFAKAFDLWREAWFRGSLAINSDPHARAVGEGFDELVALGPDVIPLLVEALSEPENFFALQLYDAIQPDSRLLIQYEPGDERIVEGEQGRARRAVQVWFANQ